MIDYLKTYQKYSNYRLPYIANLMDQYKFDHLTHFYTENKARAVLDGLLSQTEILPDAAYQRDMSMQFEWGHDHDFGKGLFLPGRMKTRHIDIPSALISLHDIDPDLGGKTVLDIGCWTGGTSLIYAALGAEHIYAIDEVLMYTSAVFYLTDFFGLTERVKAIRSSLYRIPESAIKAVDIISILGVLYHVSDPVVALRICYDLLKDGGQLWLETSAYDTEAQTMVYKGPSPTLEKEGEMRGGWTWFIPSTGTLRQMLLDVGFSDIKMTYHENGRCLVTARREHYKGMTRAGLNYR